MITFFAWVPTCLRRIVPGTGHHESPPRQQILSVVLVLPILMQTPSHETWLPLPVLGRLPSGETESDHAAEAVAELYGGSGYAHLVIYGDRVFGNPCELLVVGGASETSGIGGGTDMVGIGGATDTVGIGGASDASGIGGASDTSGIGGASDASGIGGASDTSTAGGASDTASIGGASDTSGVAGASDPSGIGGASDRSGVGGAGVVVSCSLNSESTHSLIRVPRDLPVLEYFGSELVRIDRSRIRVR